MVAAPVSVTATWIDHRWQFTIPGHAPSTSATLSRASRTARRIVADDAVDTNIQPSVGGLEDVCADAVDLGQRADAAFIRALRLRRIAVRVLRAGGIKPVDVGYLLGVTVDRAAELLREPVDSPWMATGAPPWQPLPRRAHGAAPSTAGTTRTVVAAVVTSAGSSWNLHLDGAPPKRVRTLARAEDAVRQMFGDGDADIMVCAALGTRAEAARQDSDQATAEAQELHLRAHELRADLADQLRAVGLGIGDISDLLEIHPHRVRLILQTGSNLG